MSGEIHRLPCGYCGGLAEYEDGMLRVNDEPACRDCIADMLEDTADTQDVSEVQ